MRREVVRVGVPLTLAAAVLCTSAGCFRRDRPTAVTPSAFLRPQMGSASPETTAADVPQVDNGASASLAEATSPPTDPSAPAAAGRLAAVSVASPDANLAEQLRDIPATPLPPGPEQPRLPPPPVALTGTYMTLGGVLAEVNGVPIFAARVMKELEPVLAARARQLELRQFETEARSLIQRTLNDFISEELEYANALRSLSAEDRRLADNLTTAFRQRRILEAGGSLQNAIRLAAENGDDFDELVRRENRRFLVRIYYEKKVRPRVSNATTADMRRFYRDNLTRLFTEKTEAQFRLIRVDPARHGGREAALARIRDIRDRALAGEDFAQLASTLNDDAALARRGGDVGTIGRGAFFLENVEEAVFRTEPGGLTDIVEDRGGFYLAKVESRTIGAVRPFDDPAVQAAIREALLSEEISRMRRRAVAELQRSALINTDAAMLQTAVEMAVQRYPLWRAAGG